MRNKIIIALDTSSIDKALYWVDKFSDRVEWFKVGLQLWSSGVGMSVAKAIKARGKKVFLDVKLHDIPNTVYQASLNIVELGVDMFNVHALGGAQMMGEAVRASEKSHTRVIAVTVLTSKGYNPCLVNDLAMQAVASNVDGWVASGEDAKMLTKMNHELHMSKLIVTPGIRPIWSVSKDDQKQVITPAQAIANGSDYLVIGRAITANAYPDEALNKIIKEIEVP